MSTHHGHSPSNATPPTGADLNPDTEDILAVDLGDDGGIDALLINVESGGIHGTASHDHLSGGYRHQQSAVKGPGRAVVAQNHLRLDSAKANTAIGSALQSLLGLPRVALVALVISVTAVLVVGGVVFARGLSVQTMTCSQLLAREHRLENADPRNVEHLGQIYGDLSETINEYNSRCI